MNLRYFLIILYFLVISAVKAEEPYVNDMSAGTSISGPTDEQESMFSPSSAFEGYVNKYVSSAMSKELVKNEKSIRSLSAQVAKLKSDLATSNGQFDANLKKQREDLQRCVNILSEFKKNIDTNYLYIKGIKNELLKMGVSIEDSQKNISQTSSDLQSKIDNNRSEFNLLSEQIDGKVSKRLEDSSAFESKVYGYTSVAVILIVICVLGVIASIVCCAMLLKKLLAVQEKCRKLEENLSHSHQKVSIPVSALRETKVEAPALDHSLMLKLADDVAIMETNLSGLNKEQDGYEKLKQSIDSLKKTALDSGYEFIGYIGQEYRPNMPCDADFIHDENIEQGKSVISAMIKMQVNYQGQMIQKPRFVVRQNLGY